MKLSVEMALNIAQKNVILEDLLDVIKRHVLSKLIMLVLEDL